MVVARAHDHLWGEVLWSTTEGVRLGAVLKLVDLGQPKVCEHDVTIEPEQNVFWLQVTVVNFGLV